MDNQYGIGVNNRYDLFLAGEDDSFDILRSRAATKEPKKKSKVAEKENKPIQPESKSKASTGAREGIKETKNLQNVSKKPGKSANAFLFTTNVFMCCPQSPHA